MARRERVASGRRAFTQLARPREASPSGALSAGVASQATLQFESAFDLAPELWLALQWPAASAADPESLAALARIAAGFSSRVSLEPPDGILLEVRGSLRLFGGLEALCATLLARVQAAGHTVHWSLAPTPRAALALARTGRTSIVTTHERLVGTLAGLPLSTLRWDARILARLESSGVREIGAALRLPRAGFTRRFGHAMLADLDRLVGRQSEPRRAYVPRERFRVRHEPTYELTYHDTLLRHLAPLLDALEEFLRVRQSAIEVLVLRLAHRERAERGIPPCTQLVLRLSSADFLAARFALLLTEQLARIELPAPVVRFDLYSGVLRPQVGASEGLWRPGEHGGALTRESPALVERLRARLGASAVYGLHVVDEHRPEGAWRVTEPVLPTAQRAPCARLAQARRPLWLLREPECLLRGPQDLQLLEGPERIESGWWDGHDVARDYYIARDAEGAELWIYRERLAPHAWYLHGLFG